LVLPAFIFSALSSALCDASPAGFSVPASAAVFVSVLRSARVFVLGPEAWGPGCVAKGASPVRGAPVLASALTSARLAGAVV
jgi:hypothetical protein